MNEEKEMTEQIVGGNVFEFTTERNHVAGQSKCFFRPLGVLDATMHSLHLTLGAAFFFSAELTKKKDDGKYGIGYFSPDTCDHGKTPCKFVPYPEFENLKTAYTTTTASTLTMSSFNSTRKKILKCPKNIPVDLPPTPDVTLLKCSVAQPVCSGTKANAFKKDPSKVVKMGEKKKPSNAGADATAIKKKTTDTASDGARVAGNTVVCSLAAVVAAFWLML